MAITIFDFIAKYPNCKDLDYLKSVFSNLTTWDEIFKCLLQDIDEDNCGWETPDGLFWSLYFVRDNTFIKAIGKPGVDDLPQYSCIVTGQEGFYYIKNCSSIAEASRVHTRIKEPVEKSALEDLGFTLSFY